MIVGDKSVFAWELRPVSPHWETRYLPERAAWVALSIWVNDENLCRYIDPRTRQALDELYVPLAPVADWLVKAYGALANEERPSLLPPSRSLHDLLQRWGNLPPPPGIDTENWLDEREAWWGRHFLAAGADGIQLPGLALARDDEQLIIDWAHPRFASKWAPQFLSRQGRAAVPWNDGRLVFTRVVATVADYLRNANVASAYSWAERVDPIGEARMGVEEALLLFTGRTREELLALTEARDTDMLLSRLGLSREAFDPAASPVTQALRDLAPHLPAEFSSVLGQLDEQTKPANGLAAITEARSRARDAMGAAVSPQSAGQLAAAEIRGFLGMSQQPIEDLEGVLRRFEITIVDSAVARREDRMLTGMRRGASAVAIMLSTPRTKTTWGRRFEMGRALGHLVADAFRGDAVGAASGRFSTEGKRRRAGAFSAELLLPAEAIMEATGGKLDAGAEPHVFEQLMSRYGVGARTAAHQLFNRGLLSTSSVRDELIELYAHAGG